MTRHHTRERWRCSCDDFTFSLFFFFLLIFFPKKKEERSFGLEWRLRKTNRNSRWNLTRSDIHYSIYIYIPFDTFLTPLSKFSHPLEFRSRELFLFRKKRTAIVCPISKRFFFEYKRSGKVGWGGFRHRHSSTSMRKRTKLNKSFVNKSKIAQITKDWHCP